MGAMKLFFHRRASSNLLRAPAVRAAGVVPGSLGAGTHPSSAAIRSQASAHSCITHWLQAWQVSARAPRSPEEERNAHTSSRSWQWARDSIIDDEAWALAGCGTTPAVLCSRAGCNQPNTRRHPHRLPPTSSVVFRNGEPRAHMRCLPFLSRSLDALATKPIAPTSVATYIP